MAGVNTAKVDLATFGNAFWAWKKGEITQVQASKMCGVSTPTFVKHMDEWFIELQYAIARGEIAYEK